MKKKKILLLVILIICISLIGGSAYYLSDSYPANQEEIASYIDNTNVTINKLDNGNYEFMPSNPTTGFIFYPGGKVDYEAYIPLMEQCAKQGILCVLVKMPFNLAVFDINAADDIQAQYPEVENWYIGGHSLGGSMAASYVSKHIEDYRGLILLGSYSTSDISSELDVLSIYGSEDHVLNLDKYNENKKHLPDDFKEIIIEGGCHSYFGVYGHQEGDGNPTISNYEQIQITTDEIISFIKESQHGV